MLTQQRLCELFRYDQLSGSFSRLDGTNDNAGYSHPYGYTFIKIDGKAYLRHRLAFLYMTGSWPSAQVDHINKNPKDDSWQNLREASRSQNMANCHVRKHSRSRLKGVYYDARRRPKPYRARISYNTQKISLGWFSTPQEAHAAYVKAAQHLFGDFARSQ